METRSVECIVPADPANLETESHVMHLTYSLPFSSLSLHLSLTLSLFLIVNITGWPGVVS